MRTFVFISLFLVHCLVFDIHFLLNVLDKDFGINALLSFFRDIIPPSLLTFLSSFLSLTYLF